MSTKQAEGEYRRPNPARVWTRDAAWLLLAAAALALPTPASRAGDCRRAGRAPTFAAVFLTETRLETLAGRVKSHAEPTYTAFLQLKELAAEQLERQPHVPEVWHIPNYYRDPDGHDRAKNALRDDANAAYALALCHRITGKEEYGAAAVRLVRAWTRDLGELTRADNSTLCFSYHYPAMIFAADLLRSSPRLWTRQDESRFTRFLRERALPMNTMDKANNWGNWGLVLVISVAAYTKDRRLFERAIRRWKTLIETQIAEDGHLPHEVGRSNGRRGLWYSHFCLMPQTLAAEIARVNGIDCYDFAPREGSSLKSAFEKVAAWTAAPSTFPYYDGKPDDLIGLWNVGYFEILNARWPTEAASRLLKAQRPLASEHSASHLTFTHGDLLEDETE